MSHILARLAILNFMILAAAFGVGLVSMFRKGLDHPDDPTYLIHFCLGLVAVLGALALHCLVFIYFLGTGRWVKEVAIAYQIPDAPLPKLTRELKRKTFPVALAAMLVPIAAAAAGMGVQWRDWPWFMHGILAVLTLLVTGWASGIEYRNVAINAGIIKDVMREVDRIRAERGLPSNAEALRQEKIF